MKFLSIILFSTISIFIFGQNELTKVKGIVVDSISNEVLPFASVIIDSTETLSDFDGVFSLNFGCDLPKQMLVRSVSYYDKRICIDSSDTTLIVKLLPLPYELAYIYVLGPDNPDTVFTRTNKIIRINYPGNNVCKTYYKTGQIKSLQGDNMFDKYFKNGQKKHQFYKIDDTTAIVTNWYRNGDVKSQGTMKLIKNLKDEKIKWIRNNNWKYWRKNEIKQTTANPCERAKGARGDL